MQCPKCRSKMTLLFTSAVCDVCDPPQGASTTSRNPSGEGHTVMWIYLAGSADRFFSTGGNSVRPRLTKEQALNDSPYRDHACAQFYRVYYNDCEDPQQVFAAWACPSKSEALSWVKKGNNAVWLAE